MLSPANPSVRRQQLFFLPRGFPRKVLLVLVLLNHHCLLEIDIASRYDCCEDRSAKRNGYSGPCS